MVAGSRPIRPEDYQLPLNPTPIQVQLGLTYRCNLKCEHCYALYRRDRDEMTLAELQDLLDQLYAAGSCTIVYSHGENLIRRDFHQFARMVHGREMYQTLMTNGYYIKTVEDAERLRDAGVDRFMVSLDSPDSSVHDRVRGRRGAYDVALRAVRLLGEAEVKFVGFSTTIDTHNYGSIQGVVELARDLALDGISFMQNRYNRPGVFDRALWQRYVDVCHELYETMLAQRGTLDIYTHDPFMLTLLDDRLSDPAERADFIGANICNVGTSMVSIDPVGNVSGCNFLEESVGNVRTEPFADIWERLVRRYSDVDEPPSGPCASCDVRNACMGGCKAFHYNGKYDERCGETRFGEPDPHGLTTLALPMYPTAPSHGAPGVFQVRSPRCAS